MKRKLTLLLSAVMAASSLPMTAYAANFKDINEVPWASSVINSVADKGLVGGYEDNTFRGKNNVTYCEAMQMVYTTLTKTGRASFDAVNVYSYMSMLDTYKVPKWAQMAVAYGLSEGIVDMQTVITKFSGGTKVATREDVAVLFGNAMGQVFGKERNTSGAEGFTDYWSISVNALEQVSMLKEMGIISGDNFNRFNPKNSINRAEMAVMLNNTYNVLTEGVVNSGEIVELVSNKGTDGVMHYYISIEKTDGHKEGFSVTEGDIPVYAGNTSQKISLSSLSEGDQVQFMFSGSTLTGIRQMSVTTSQEKYDITGYIVSFKDNELSVDNENTGERDKYSISNSVECYVDGEEVSRKVLEEILKERYNEYAYVGLNVEMVRDKIDGEYKDVTKVKELYVTFAEEQNVMGEVTGMNTSGITLKQEDSSAKDTYFFADDCEFFIAEKEVDYAEAKELYDRGTTYAKISVNMDEKVTKVQLGEDTFTGSNAAEESRTYKVKSLTDDKLTLEDGGKTITYKFGSSNSLSNIRFYEWDYDSDVKDGSWDELKDVDDAVSKVDAWEGQAQDDTVYAKITTNSGGKLSEVYLTNKKAAFKYSEDHQTERKGTVASLKNDVLKFQTSTVEYKMLKKYEDGELEIGSALTNSKNVLERMANDSSLELYAEIKANGDNEVVEIEARLTEAKGKLVELELDASDEYIEIETEDGNTFKLACQSSPELTDEDEDYFNLDDISGTRYAGEEVELGFNSNGVVDTITIVDGPRDFSATAKVKGIATAANDGLKVKGDSTTYRWLSKKADISLTNYSSPSESIDTVKRMIEDPDLEVYVEARLDDKDRVEGIKVYVREAEGEIDKDGYDNYIRINTEAGNTFSFDVKADPDINIGDLDEDDLEDGKADGKDVKLTFGNDGRVSKIEEK